MDPNLTLAHITHNTAVVLLHQYIAYPSAEWLSVSIRLPSASSSETCLAAATEMSIIAEKFMQSSAMLTNPQFAFCLFVCGRMLLVHSVYYSIELSMCFDSIVNSLREIGRRWVGHFTTRMPHANENLASKFASRLLQIRQQGTTSLDVRQAAYAQDSYQINHTKQPPQRSSPDAGPIPICVTHPSTMLHSHSEIDPTMNTRWDTVMPVPAMSHDSPDSISMAFPPLPLAFQGVSGRRGPNTPASVPSDHIPPQTASNAIVYQNPPGTYTSSSTYEGARPNEYEQLNQFLNYDYMLSQRVSMFSNDDDKYG
jgi:hypothetical protein